MTSELVIVRGRGGALRVHPALRSGDLVLDADPARPSAWGGCRLWLGALTEALGWPAVVAALEAQRGELAVVLGGLGSGRPCEGARLPTFLSHNGLLSEGLFRAWLGVWASIGRGPFATIVVPEIGRLDHESLVLLRLLVASTPAEARPRLIFGHDPSARPDELHARRGFDLNETELALLEAMPGCSIASIEAPDEPDTSAGESGVRADGPGVCEGGRRASTPCPVDDELEARAFRSLEAGAGVDAALVLRALRAAFDARGFGAALALALALLEGGLSLSDGERAEAHTLAALSAYNRHVESAGNVELAAFLLEHFGAALALEREPARRAHLLQRLAMARSRRLGDFDEALTLCDRAIEASCDAGIAPAAAALCEGWSRNGRAYVLHRLGRRAEAYVEMRLAYDRVCAPASDDGAPRGEIEASTVVFLDNLAELAEASGDVDAALGWQGRLADAERAREGGALLASHRMLRLLARRPGRLREALGGACAAYAEATRLRDAVHAERYAAAAADLSYRAGELDEALAWHERSLALRRLVAVEASEVEALRAAGVAALRGGQLARARALLGEALSRTSLPAVQADLAGWLGIEAARSGAPADAEALVDEAIEAALRSGQAGALVRAGRHAASACEALGRDDDRREALERALEVARARLVETPSSELFGTLADRGAPGPELVEALSLAPAALADAEAWWALPALVRATFARARAGELPEAARPVALALAEAAGQRAGEEGREANELAVLLGA